MDKFLPEGAFELGIAGVTVLGLLWFLHKLLADHSDERREFREMHRAEREAWSNTQEKRDVNFIAAMKDLEYRIQERKQ